MTQIVVGHALEVLRGMESDRFQCVVTSPPYFCLRRYHTTPQVWGGREDCEHDWQTEAYYRTSAGCAAGREAFSQPGPENVARLKAAREATTTTCRLCGAWRGELGAEPDPRLYVAHLLEVFAEVKRVLRPDGVLWLNIGDSYNGSDRGRHTKNPPVDGEQGPGRQFVTQEGRKIAGKPTGRRGGDGRKAGLATGIPAKSLCLVPERLLLGLAEQGWIMRDRVIWVKASRHTMRLVSMPTSAKDRLKPGWEFVYMLAKGQHYKGEVERIGVPPAAESRRRGTRVDHAPGRGDYLQHGHAGVPAHRKTVNPGNVWFIPPDQRKENHFAAFPNALVQMCLLPCTDPGDEVLDPFVGRGTTVIVAKQLGRRGVGIELNPEYAALAEANIRREAAQEVLL